MFAVMESALVEAFAALERTDALAISAVNLAMVQCLRAPLFADRYASHVILETGPGLFQLHNTNEQSSPVLMDPLRHDYCDYFDEDEEGGLPHPETYRDNPRPVSEMPPDVEDLANHLLIHLKKALPESQSWFSPTDEDLAGRQTISFQKTGQEEMEELMQEVLGQRYDRSLRRHGISYHQPVSWSRGPSWSYVVAHNGKEVAGVSGWTESERAVGLSYISVAPGFRGRGISSRMYEELIDHAVMQGKLIIRSQPGKFASERPAITAAYDRMLLDAPVLHVVGGGYLHKAVLDAGEGLDAAAWVARCKPACDELLRAMRAAPDEFGWSDIDARLANEIRNARPLPRPRGP